MAPNPEAHMKNNTFRPDPLKDFRRALAVKALAAVRDRDVTQTAERLYGKADAELHRGQGRGGGVFDQR